MNVLTISGSSRLGSNTLLLDHLSTLQTEFAFTRWSESLPLFQVENDKAPWSKEVLNFRAAVGKADAVIISTPAYLFNIPATLKNMLEWLTSSGELVGKKVLALTYTPSDGRGKEAMQSLKWSLGGLDARVVTTIELHQSEIKVVNGMITGDQECIGMLTEAIGMLGE